MITTMSPCDLFADEAFAALVQEAQACRACPRMEGRRRVLSPANGPLSAKILFIAEAPGRLGGDKGGIPLTGDASGRNFLRYLSAAGLKREDVFVSKFRANTRATQPTLTTFFIASKIGSRYHGAPASQVIEESLARFNLGTWERRGMCSPSLMSMCTGLGRLPRSLPHPRPFVWQEQETPNVADAYPEA